MFIPVTVNKLENRNVFLHSFRIFIDSFISSPVNQSFATVMIVITAMMMVIMIRRMLMMAVMMLVIITTATNTSIWPVAIMMTTLLMIMLLAKIKHTNEPTETYDILF